MKKIAIVGSEEKHWTSTQREKVVKKIKEIIYPQRVVMGDKGFYETIVDPILLISGGCPKGGVDIWAEVVADTLGVKKKIYSPDVDQWDDEWVEEDRQLFKGYKSRNKEIAYVCDELWCFDPEWREWSGGKWTQQYAENLGKKTHLVGVS